MANTDEVIAALKKAAAKVAAKQVKNTAVQSEQQNQQNQQIQSRETTQAEKDLNTIKPASNYTNSSGFLKGSAFADIVNGKKQGTTSSSTPSAYQLKEAIDKKERQTGWEKFTNTVKNIGTSIYQFGKGLVSEYITNQDKEKGILDYDKYQQYQAQIVSDSTTQEQRDQLINKMVSEGVVDEQKFNAWATRQREKQEEDPNALINQVREDQREEYRNELKAVLEPYVKEATNHYQMDAYSKAVDRLMKQFDYSFDNVINTYDDTRNRNIIEYWNTDGTTFKEGIKEFLGYRGDYISKGYTDKEAYKAVIKEHADVADKIVNAENRIKNMTYKAVISDNFSKEGNISGTTFTQITNGILGVVNNISFMVDKVMSQPLEELKQKTNYYDVVEELANLNIQNEADGWMKRGYKTVASWIRSVYDAAPTVLPTVAGVILTKKLAIPEKLTGAGKMGEEIINGRKVLAVKGSSFLGNFAGNWIEDLAILDGVAQVSIGGPITKEDAVWNATINMVVDAFAAKFATKKAMQYLSEIPRGDMMSRVLKKELVDELSTIKDLGKAAEYYVNYLTLDIINGTKDIGKTVNLDELIKTAPEMVERTELIQKIGTQVVNGLKEGDTSAKHLAELYNLELKEQMAKFKTILENNRAQKAAEELVDQRTLSTNPKYKRSTGVYADETLGKNEVYSRMSAQDIANRSKIGGSVSDVAKQVIDDAEFVTKMAETNQNLGVKMIHTTIRSLNQRGIISDEALEPLVRNAVGNDNSGLYDVIYGLLKGGSDGNEMVSKGYTKIQAAAKEEGGPLGINATLIDAYNNMFAQVIKTYGDIMETGDTIGTYMKQADGTFKDIFTGKVGTADEISSKYMVKEDETINHTIQNIAYTKEGIAKDIAVAKEGDGEIIRQSKSGGTRYKSGSTVWSTGGKNGSEKSILMNNYFIKSTGKTGADGLPIDKLGSFTAEQFYKDKGYNALARKIFGDIGFDFAVTKDTIQGKDVYHMYIWSRNTDNAKRFADILSDLETKDNLRYMTTDEFFTFKASHIGEYLDTFKSYADANGYVTNANREIYANKFKTWFEGLYERKGDEYIMKGVGTPDQTNRLAKAVNSNASLKAVEEASASNEISSTVKEISDELGFTTEMLKKENKILKQKSIEGDIFETHDQIVAGLKSVFSKHYNDQKLYDQIVNYLADFIMTFMNKDGIKPGVVQAIGDMYSKIITSPETLKALSKFDRGFFSILTAKLIYNGVDANAREFEQAFAEFMKEYSDRLFGRIGTDNLAEYINLSVYDKGDLELFSGIKQFAENIQNLTRKREYQWDSTKHMRGDKGNALYSSLDSKKLKDRIMNLGIIDTQQRELFFKEGLSTDALITGRNFRNNKIQKDIRFISKKEISDLVDYVTFKELSAAGIYDYSMLQEMRRGLVDMIDNAKTLDNKLKVSLIPDRHGKYRLLTKYHPEKSTLNLGPIDLSRLRLRGSRGSEIYREGLLHELGHVESIAAYNKSMSDYVALIEKQISELNPSDRADLMANMSYLLAGDKTVNDMMARLTDMGSNKSLNEIADIIWNSYNKDFKTVDRFTAAQGFFMEYIHPLEELIREAYTMNSLFGASKELPKGFSEAISQASKVYEMYNKIVDMLEMESFESLDDFKKALYNSEAKIELIKSGDEGWYYEDLARELTKTNPIDELGFTADEDITSMMKELGWNEMDNGMLSKYAYDYNHGLLNQNIPEGKVLENIIKYSLIGKNTVPSRGGFLDQITKSYINPQNDMLINAQAELLKYFQNNGLTKKPTVSILGIVNNQTLPLLDSQIGQKVATILNNIVQAKQGGAYIKLDANELLVGRDVLDSYKSYIKEHLGGNNLYDYIDGVEVNGRFYKSFDEYIKDNGLKLRDKDFENKVMGIVNERAEFGVPGDERSYRGIIQEEIMNRFDNKTYKNVVEDWNNAVAEKFLNLDESIMVDKDIMPLQTYIMSRHVINILNAIGEYTGIGDNKFIRFINNSLQEQATTKVFSELTKEGNYGPAKYILNILADNGTIEEKYIDKVLTLLGDDSYLGAVNDLLDMTHHTSIKEGDALFSKMRNAKMQGERQYILLDDLREKLGVSKNDIEQINQSLGNLYKKDRVVLQDASELAEQEYVTAGRLYNRLVGLANDIKHMEEFNGALPNQNSVGRAMVDNIDIESDILGSLNGMYDNRLIDLVNAANDWFEWSKNKYLINGNPNLMINESRPFNIRSNLGIQLSQFIDNTTQAQRQATTDKLNSLIGTFKYTTKKGGEGTTYIITNNARKTLNNIPLSDHIDYLQANGIKKTKEEGMFDKVIIQLTDDDGNVSMYNLYSGKGRIPTFEKKGLDTTKPRKVTGVEDREFSTQEELRNLIYSFDQKRSVGVILQYNPEKYQVQNKNAKYIKEGVVRNDGLIINYNNIFSSFIGRDICEKLGIEKDFLNSSQNNLGTLNKIYSRLSDIYNTTKNEEYKKSLAKTMNSINRVFKRGLSSKIYDNSLTRVFNDSDFIVRDIDGNKLDFKITSYIPTMSVGKTTMDTELEGIGDITENELISSKKRVSSQIDYDRFKEEVSNESMGENATINQQIGGSFIVKGVDPKGRTIYGILSTSEVNIKDTTFIPYEENINYEALLMNGNITQAEYEKLILAGDQIREINKASGIETKFVVSDNMGLKSKEINALVNQLNTTLDKIHKDEVDLVKAKANREKLKQLDDRLKANKNKLNEVSRKINDELGFTDEQGLDITPAKSIDTKAKAKGSIANKFIGYADGLEGSSTAEYAKQAGDKANVGKYEKGDVVFVSVPGKRGDYKIRHEQQNKTILEAAKALDEGATIITDSKAYLRKSDYNEGEQRLMNYLYKKGYVYENVNIDGTIVGSWTKPEGKATPYEVKKNDFNAKKTWSEGKIPAIRRTIEGEYSGPHSFGNPFDGRTRGEYGVKEATNRFYHWIKGDAYQDVNPEQREWIVNQIKDGSLKGKTVVYYTDTIPAKENDYGVKEYDALHPNHAMVLQRFINGEYKINDGGKVSGELGFLDESSVTKGGNDLLDIGMKTLEEQGYVAKTNDESQFRFIKPVEGFGYKLSDEIELKNGVRISLEDMPINKEIDTNIYKQLDWNKSNSILGEDGKFYNPNTIEGNEALKNGGVDMDILERSMINTDYISDAQENKIASNLFSFGNYDVIQANPILEGIAGHRVWFMDNNKTELKEAIDNFNALIKDLSEDDKEKIFRTINEKARSILKEYNAKLQDPEVVKDYVKKPCNIDLGIKIEGAAEIQQAVRNIGNIFVHADTANNLNPSWSWVHQFATLNYKGGFDDLWMRLNSNEFAASVDYLLHQGVSITDGKDLREYIRGLVKSTGANDGKTTRFVHDWFGDSLGTSALYKMDANAKSIYRIFKYSPLSPISGTLMLIQSTLLGLAMYFSKKVGLGKLMDSPLFNLLTTKKGEKVMIDGVEQEGLGWLYSLTRQGDINLNSNTDLGRTLVDKTLDRILGIVPMPKGMRDSVQSVMKGGVQSIWDIASQSSVKNMSLAQALVSNGITTEYQLKNFLAGIKSGKISNTRIAKILGDAEVNYSRFFSNSATTVMSRNRFSRLWMFNCMNNYTILRSDEVVQGVMKFWRDWRSGMLNDMSFGEYLFEKNPELKGLMNNVLMSVKMGYHFNLMANGDNDNQENLEKYIVDSSDYLSSIPATFFYNILSAPFKGVGDYIEYTNAVGESETFGGAAKAAALTTLSKTMSQFFREGKVLNVMRDWLVAYAKTGDLDYSNTVAGVDLEKIANGLGRFMLVEGTESYGSASLTEKGDAIGQILFNSFETNQYGKAKTKLNNIVTAEEYINGDMQDNVINILAYMPVLGEFIKNATTGQGFTFTQAKYEELEKMVDNSPVIQNLYKGILNTDDFTDAAINRLYSELIKYDYTANRTLGQNGEYKLGSYDNKTGKDTTLNDMKEAVFTKNMLDKLGLSREEFVAMLNKADDGDDKALIKILAIAEAAEPGSSRVCLSYLANNYHYELMKEYSGKTYPSGNDVTEEQANEINRMVVQKYYPEMFTVDKTSLYKAIREYISIANPTVFDTLYRDDDLSGYVNSLGYLDMLMFQFAHQDGDVDARYIKNAFSLIGKYVQNTDARISIMNHTMQTIEDLDTYDSVKTMMKMGVIAGNTDIYDKIKNDEIMNIMNPEILQRYENFVWGVNEEINQKGTELAQKELSDKEKKQYKGIYGKNFKYSNYANGNSKTQDEVQDFAAKVFPIADTPTHKFTTIPYTASSFTPYKHSPLYFYIKIYEDTIKETSDKLVTTTGKKYPAQTIEGMTYHGNTSNKGKISAKKLEFPTKRRRATSYSTDRWAGYPGG